MSFNANDNRYKRAGGSKLIAEDDHAFMAIKADYAISKQSGNPMVALEIEVIDETDNDRAKVVKEWIVLVDERWGLGKLQSLCKSIGNTEPVVFPEEYDDEEDPAALHLFNDDEAVHKKIWTEWLKANILGAACWVKIKHEDNNYEGRVYKQSKVAWFYDSGLPENVHERLAEQYSDGDETYITPDPSAGADIRAEKSGDSSPPADDSDIPFPDDDDLPF